MKTAVSLPDELFSRADGLARRLGKSRSQLYRDALSEYVSRHDPESITASWNAVIDEVGSEPDPWLAEAARQALARTEW